MQISSTGLEGLFTIGTTPSQDERGYYHRLYDAATFAAAGIDFVPRQGGISHNARRGTLRGMHYQKAPVKQAKLVRCLTGTIFDVAIDLRPESTTYTRWFGIELTAENNMALFIPSGFAHGFITQADNTDVLYELGAAEQSDCAAGVRWNDPAFGVAWPLAPIVVNIRDAGWPDYRRT
ncbi:MAG: dTDP-4-dehydrorhamnose 3,5-epimerase family protein [Ferrovibrio sp.]|uniref:dTDP-4-dehydrorhamnose 3,5-epimerase family protein n=1 Tax=Ferrovibrio sp. TaxID=1917215 RepID=UPI00263344AD|nr:dTDP-4-dehydrorhamnose 3,5-epimerase family protein [Ferrovibrio sp.]MCW0234905.1 dTDP-4-dehydrorhamnose 3,5-epimerase family protein [Ferrovibrio sp.]